MPELPEVQTVVTTLRPRLLGRRLVAARLARADVVCPPGTDLAALVEGRRVADLARRGKRIVVTLDDGCRFYVHLGMTGQLTVADAAVAALPHTHLEVELSPSDAGAAADGTSAGGSAAATTREVLRFRDARRFGGIWWLGRDGQADRGMGPEPLTLRPAALLRRLGRTGRNIKTALLDQALVAGLGNIYVDESLFLARLHPLRPACELTPAEVGRLSRAIKVTLRKAIRHRGS
ncbi:MAG TPA: DNA-formamidopyrimidine glycosylase family protein, partial [Humisphaera sp.]